jgi:ATP synthase protein I
VVEIGKRVRHLRAGLLASAALLVLGLPAGAVVRGGSGAGGVAAGVGLVAVSYTLSSLIIAWADSIEPRLVLPAGLMTYVLKFALIGLLMAGIAGSGWAGLAPMGVAILGTVLAWIVAQAWWTWRARILYVEV